ncbi:hypothetical protein J2S89_002735 [Arthrobacter bambusae]|nr:hypothetical protein [Arthrobacter bambusae]MDQ0099261.1 hypothetical protein [Arthrobacter bambusae]
MLGVAFEERLRLVVDEASTPFHTPR